MLVKLYGDDDRTSPEREYSPSEFNGERVDAIEGKPDLDHISTIYVERQNLTMRMSMRCFVRLTNASSRKIANHIHMLSLHFGHDDFVQIHQSLRCTPAMAAGVTDALRDMEWIVGLINAWVPKPKRLKTYRKRIAK